MADDRSPMGSNFASMGLGFFTRINPNLLVPVVIVFLLVSMYYGSIFFLATVLSW